MSNRKSLKKQTLFATVGLLGICVVGGGLVYAQTKQLKESANTQVVTKDDSESNSNASNNVLNGLNVQNGNSNSVSISVESKTGPDGKIIQKRKVWQNGRLIQDEEKTLDNPQDADAFGTTIQLPNGAMQQSDPFFDMDDSNFPSFSSSPFEAIRQMEEQMKAQQEQMRRRFEALRQQLANDPNGAQLGGNGVNGVAPNVAPQQAPSKYWIGLTLQPIPIFLANQLPLEENQGVWVLNVFPESPAAKAGLKQYDVLFKIDDKIVSNPEEVSAAVNEAGAKKIAVEYYRKGKLEKAEITVEERPQNVKYWGAPLQNKDFRVVRPGLIVPAPEAEVEQPEARQQESDAQDAPVILTEPDEQNAPALKIETESPEQQTAPTNEQPKEEK